MPLHAGLPLFEIIGLQAPLPFINVFQCDSYRRLMFNFKRAFKQALFPDGLLGTQDGSGLVGFTGSASLHMGDLPMLRSNPELDDISQGYLTAARAHFPLLADAQATVLGEDPSVPVDYSALRRLGLLPHLAQCQYLQMLAAAYMVASAVNQAPLVGEHGLYLVSEVQGSPLDRTLAKILYQVAPQHLMRVAPGDHASGIIYTAQILAMWFRANYFSAQELAEAIRANVPPRPRCLLLPSDPEPVIPGTAIRLELRRSPPSSTGVVFLGAEALVGDAASTLTTSLCTTCGTQAPIRHTFCRTCWENGICSLRDHCVRCHCGYGPFIGDSCEAPAVDGKICPGTRATGFPYTRLTAAESAFYDDAWLRATSLYSQYALAKYSKEICSNMPTHLTLVVARSHGRYA